ncbi:hypothetical protein Sjap_004976 [Stephania japonica]|uniref:Uncharacterized protein n=1 Tax=Stephania japonica TaxID=461633 RepID=A0AAP0PHG8_9MAGN
MVWEGLRSMAHTACAVPEGVRPMAGPSSWLTRDWRRFDFIICTSSSSATVAKPGEIKHMENAYPGSNILVVTLPNEESKRVEVQSEKETLREAIGVLRDIFGQEVPTVDRIIVPP